jgi:protein-L-isoaspartate(D-aspartate) O-methyltransferase
MLPRWVLFVFAMFVAVTCHASAEEAQCVNERAAMIDIIRAHAQRDTAELGPQGISPAVLKVMASIERHRFIPNGSCEVGYLDRPVSIGYGSTISQPFIIALMTHLANVASGETALEIGTGSGYQAAVLGRLVKNVCTIELVPELALTSAKALTDFGFHNVRVRVGDGYRGWAECGPFDAIIVTAALEHVPPPLIEQLKVGGRLIIPLGYPNQTQGLTVLEKLESGKTTARIVSLVRFVPFVRPPNE